MGALYLASKLEECALRMRDLINVFDLLTQQISHRLHRSVSPLDDSTTNSNRGPEQSQDQDQDQDQEFQYKPMTYFSQTYYDLKDTLIVAEMQLLKRLGFDVHVALPYGTLVNYLQVLGLVERSDVCQRAWSYLNDA